MDDVSKLIITTFYTTAIIYQSIVLLYLACYYTLFNNMTGILAVNSNDESQ